MKTLFGPGSGGFFGGKKYSPDTSSSTKVTTSAFSQANVLKRKMQDEKLTHAETVKASISPVRLESYPGKMVLYFCPMKSIEVHHTIAAGDGGGLPSGVSLEGLEVPMDFQPGLYALKNVLLSSNGTMQVIGTDKTVWEKYTEEVC